MMTRRLTVEQELIASGDQAMIVDDKRSWIRMVFAVRGSCLHLIFPRMLTVAIFSSLVTWVGISFGIENYSLTTTPFTLIGLALAIFLGFRNNEAYDRFWEGRKLWGGMVNVTRSFTRQTLTLIIASDPEDAEEVAAIQRELVRHTIAYVYAFRHHLRDTDPTHDLGNYLQHDQRSSVLRHKNVPLAILQTMGERIHRAWQSGYVDTFHVPVLEESLTEMTAIQGGCERIKLTPIPFTYNVLIHRIVAIYCLAMPFGLLETAGALTPVVVCLISYAFFGLDAIGDDVEQPFETDDNDLPLEAISRTIEINLLQLIGEQDIPEPVQAVNGILL